MEYFIVTIMPWMSPSGDTVPPGMAVNKIMADADFAPGPGLELQIIASQPWYSPKQSVVVPISVALWQAKAALFAVGKLDAASTMVSAIGGNVALAWEYGNTIDRNSPTMQSLATHLGLSVDDLDNLFIAASKISI